MEQSLTHARTNPMKMWTKKISFLITAGVVYLLGEFLSGVWLFASFCQPYAENGKIYCNSPYLDIGFAFIAVGQVLAIVGIILLFANTDGFRAWWRFSRWYVPIAAIIIIFFTPVALFSSLMLSSVIPRDRAVYDFGAIYILVTLILVIRGFSASRRKV